MKESAVRSRQIVCQLCNESRWAKRRHARRRVQPGAADFALEATLSAHPEDAKTHRRFAKPLRIKVSECLRSPARVWPLHCLGKRRGPA
jgi:hypothetical protein